jgi:hypothetical protein
LETANGQVTLDIQGDVVCDGVLLKDCVYNPSVDFSLMSVSCLENEGWIYTQGGGSCQIVGEKEQKELVRSGGLYLLGLEGHVLSALEASAVAFDGRAGAVPAVASRGRASAVASGGRAGQSPAVAVGGRAELEASAEIVISANDEVLLRVPKMPAIDPAHKPCYLKDGIALDHLRQGHKPFDPLCSTCQFMKMKAHQHRRVKDETEEGQLSADLAGPWPESLGGAKYLLLMVRRKTRMYFIAALANKTSHGIKEAMIDFKLLLKDIWRFHSDRGKEFMGEMDRWMRENLIVHTTTEGYDSKANGIAERGILEVTQGIRVLLHQAGAPRTLWDEAARHFVDILNRMLHTLPDGKKVIPLVAERENVTGKTEKLHGDDDPMKWPPWGCRVVALVPQIHRDTKLDPVAVLGLFLGYDVSVTGGVRVAVLKDNQGNLVIDKIIVSTTVRTKDEEFPLAASKKPSDDELKAIEFELKGELVGEPPAEKEKVVQDTFDVLDEIFAPEKAKRRRVRQEETPEPKVEETTAEGETAPGEPASDIPVEEIERQVHRAEQGAMRERPDDYSALDDVPHCMKKARAAAVVADPKVIAYFENRGEFEGWCWACGGDAPTLVCRPCLEEYGGAVETATANMEVRAGAVSAKTFGKNATDVAYIAAVKDEVPDIEVEEILGRQAAFVMKDLDPAAALGDKVATAEMLNEYRRLDSAMDETVELESIPDKAIVVKVRMLLGIKHWEDETKHKHKARMVVMGNVLFDKHMSVLKGGDMSDLWAPVASLTGVRVVEARAAAHRRKTSGIDLVAAYTQIPMGGDRPYYVILPQVAFQIMEEKDAVKYKGFRQPVRRALKAWYGIPRSGTDFIKTFGAWLRLIKWQRVPEEPALFVNWLTEEMGAVMRRAVHHRDRLKEKFAVGENPLLKDEAFAREPEADWDSEKRRASSSTKCALMSTYVDDCSMDAKSSYAGSLWNAIRLLFVSDDPAEVQRIVGLARADLNVESMTQPALSQEDYLESSLATLPPEWAPRKAVKTNGQSGTIPDPAKLEMRACPTIVRSILGTLMYAARSTRPDLSYSVSRLARYVDRWSDPWAEKELKHVLAYVLGSTQKVLCFRYMGELWEDLWLEVYSDANFAAPCSEGGWGLFLVGEKGTFMPLEWKSRKQRLTATSSAESELMEMADAVKATLRMQGLLECCRTTKIKAKGFVDNDAVRMAAARGSSAKLGHMRKHAEVNLEFLKECGIPLFRVDTTDNPADIFTKIVSAQRLMYHMACFDGNVRVKNEHGSIVGCMHEVHAKGCENEGMKEVGLPKQVITCPCIVAKKLMLLTLATTVGGAKATKLNEEIFGDSGLLYLGLVGVALAICLVIGMVVRRPDGVVEIDGEEFDAECEMIANHTQDMYNQVEDLTQQLEVMSIRASMAESAVQSRPLGRGAAAATTTAVSKKVPPTPPPRPSRATSSATSSGSAAASTQPAATTVVNNITIGTGRENPSVTVGGWSQGAMGKVPGDTTYLHACGAGVERRCCGFCKSRSTQNGVIYITERGECWHTASDCRAIVGRDFGRYRVCLGRTEHCVAAEPTVD